MRKDHLAHHTQTVPFKEHMLRAAQTDALGQEVPRSLRIGRRIGVRTHANVTIFIRPFQQCLERVIQRGFFERGRPCQNIARRTIDGDYLTLGKFAAVRCDHHAALFVDHKVGGANHTGQTKTASDHSRVAGDTAADSQNRIGGVHPANILGRCFATNEDTRLAPRGTGLRIIRRKHNAPDRSTGARRDTANDPIAFGHRRNLTVEQFRQNRRINTHHGFIGRDNPILGQCDRNTHRRAVGSLNPNTVKDMQLTVFNREFDLHFLAQTNTNQFAKSDELCEQLGQFLFDGWTAPVLDEIECALRSRQGLAALALA